MTEVARRYLVCPGFVTSRTDGHDHYLSAGRLMQLYGAPPALCTVLLHWTTDRVRRREQLDQLARGEFVALSPRYDGDYTLPPL